MLTVKSKDVRDNFESLCDKVFRGETLVISRPNNENIVMMSEREYNEIMQTKKIAEYFAMMYQSIAETAVSGYIEKSISEQESLE